MNLSEKLAKHVRGVHFGGNWSDSNLKDQLSDVSWQQANQKIGDLNTILALTYHINYYVGGVLQVLRGSPLDIRDKFSFDHSAITSAEDWQNLLEKMLQEGEEFAAAIEQLPDAKLEEAFVDEKYGTYHSNLIGIIEHTHYHLGQIALIKKMVQADEK
ncbi:DinB family protein [Flavilitoribacter nigricans]|uniref:DUF1572 domain-containing protein n=1 Tax=Flavilitoribacter nigricans (strain ATCC 23147 / DSM 23189 / NBRC 102662 / NCIMB 1420 / SS-2) TaxID=1122177 RepID=A0A2D0N547_FLAN2|nr:DinB family protein [Flavilitoribacter nigricans]PHN03625.1 DUF1572 domain-containing protein [Flavilitoribacter nigricans DSM 23189 = NBRC 102662]